MIRLPKQLSLWKTIGLSLLFLAVVGLLDYLTGKLSFLLFYFIPIGIAAWYGGRIAGLALATLSTASWFASYLAFEYYGLGSAIWDLAAVMGVFAAFALLMAALRTARDRAEAAARELAESNKDLQNFAYMASHDLQEPLRGVTLFLELLERQYGNKLDERANEFVHHASDSARRMSQLIRDLLAFSRVQLQEAPFERTDCNEVLHQALADLQTVIRERGAAIQADPLPVLNASPTLMRQLFQNLVSNGIKFHDDARPCGAHQRQRDRWGLEILRAG